MSAHSQHAAVVLRRPLNLTTTTVERDYNGDWLITLPVAGASAVAEYRLHAVDTNLTGLTYWPSDVYHMYGIRVVEAGRAYRLVAHPSALEYAIMIAPTGAALVDYNFYGSVHQNQRRTAFAITLDGASIADLPGGAYRTGACLVVSQTAEIIQPQDMTTVIGETGMTHTFTAAGCQVNASHSYAAGYSIKTAYTAMLSTIDQDGRGVDTVQIGDNAPLTRQYNDGDYNVGSLDDTAIGYHSSAHPYRVRMDLPTGGPDMTGDWTYTGGYGMWFKDYGASNNYIGKVYATRVGAAPIAAADFAHRQVYTVEAV